MECRKEHSNSCKCTYGLCSRKKYCCECLTYHLGARELPACCFPADAEKTYDRSFEHFVKLVKSGAI
jgi:hypothetical protein